MAQLHGENPAEGEADRRVHGVPGRGRRAAVCLLCCGGELRE